MLDSGHYWQSPYIDWAPEIPDDWNLFVVYMRTARIKARVPAVLEVLSLLRPFQPIAPLRGPRADEKGVFWIAVAPSFTQPALQLLPRLGYSFAVDRVLPEEQVEPANAELQQDARMIAWSGGKCNMLRVY
jgi:hypothetical protein